MRVITKITQQKRLKDRYNIFLDKEYAFSVEEVVLINYNLQKGTTLSTEEIDEIIEATNFQKAYLMAVNYISYRMRSIKEVNTYLREKEIGRLEIEKIITDLLDKKYLNDAAFAKAFVIDKMNQTTKGPKMIKQELFEKGVSGQLAEDALAEYGYESQFEVAFKWAQQHQRRSSRHSHQRRRQQLRGSLMQKGFAADVINDVMQEVNQAVDQEAERASLAYHGDRLLRRNESKHTGYELTNKIKTGLYSRGFSGELISEYIEKMDEEMI